MRVYSALTLLSNVTIPLPEPKRFIIPVSSLTVYLSLITDEIGIRMSRNTRGETIQELTDP